MAADVIVVGAGHNGLIAAALLALAGRQVEVLERNPAPGGAIATEELTLPGFRHDTFSGWHPQWLLSAAWEELRGELEARGLRYVIGDLAAATVGGDAEPVIAWRDRERTAGQRPAADREDYLEELAGFDRIAPRLGAFQESDTRSRAAFGALLALGARVRGPRGPELLGRVAGSAGDWFGGFEGDQVGRLWGPWTLHTGLGPADPGGGLRTLGLATALQEIGMPVVAGGSANLVKALAETIEARGGAVRTSVEVDRVLVEGGRCVGVAAAGERYQAGEAVVANLTPTQLYDRLLGAEDLDPALRRAVRAYRYSRRAGMQIHLALAAPPRWREPALADVPMVHVADGLEAVRRACAEAEAGLVPACPTIACGQHAAVDPSRVPTGKGLLWIQLLDLPSTPSGDAAGQVEATGAWSTELAEAVADRVVEQLGAHIEGLEQSILARSVISPADLERRNPNLVGGDIYAGATDLAQSYFSRPFPGHSGHRTPVRGLYICGASTHPGPGLNGASGRIVARQILRRRRGRG
ncbi:MAG: NAD(P)/FAD-dependent oxidoreductase [Actinobacteria bacterium]|nr:NAD(P)/FAD-dependent oxidoreductase [Actinomycetota bacterium]